jgi:(1->4)-alpha-D-glucan 1-alpha-D-glucosylmutase
VHVLERGLEALKEELPAEDPSLRELQSVRTALWNLPPHASTEPGKKEERQREKEVCRERLRALAGSSPRVRRHIEDNVRAFNGEPGRPESFDALHAFLEAQPYRLAYWRTALDEINYRRFFDNNQLAGLREENPEVFDRVHAKVLELVREGKVTGLRLDHIDGLHDPEGYLAALRRRLLPPGGPGAAGDFYVVVEKVLSLDESLPASWPVQGTTGYDFLNDLNGLFVYPRSALPLKTFYARQAGRAGSFVQVMSDSKRRIMVESMTSELTVLAAELNRLSEEDRRSRDFTLESLRRALREVVADFPIYRTYAGPSGWTEADGKVVDAVLERTRHAHPTMEPSILGFLREVLLPAPDGGPEKARRRLDFSMRFQQYTSPVQAKGLEDTAFYRYNLLISLNEVGGDPQRFGRSLNEFHESNAVRQARYPLGMLSTSTHDTKRGEDARARIDAIPELALEWRRKVAEWNRINASHRAQVAGALVPDRNGEYFFYQALVGSWPDEAGEEGPAPPFMDRLKGYLVKAMREAKLHTSWIHNNIPYEEAFLQFIERSLTGPRSQRFLASFIPFQRRAAFFGMVNGLSQVALKNASPGVPDLYQGCELWNLDMADPDNRRPVDFDLRRRLLEGMAPHARGESSPQERRRFLEEVLSGWRDGRVKMFLTARCLRLRRERPALFQRGDYVPLAAEGPRADSLAAFARRFQGEWLVAAVPRFPAVLTGGEEKLPVGREVWGDTRLFLPPDVAVPELTEAFTGKESAVETERGRCFLRVAGLFDFFPWGLLFGR